MRTRLRPGDYVQFAFLPADTPATPIKVAEVDADGYVRLEGRGYWIPPGRLRKADVLDVLREQAVKVKRMA